MAASPEPKREKLLVRALMVIISNANKGVGSVVVMSRSGSGISMLMRLVTLQDPITTNVSVSESFFLSWERI